MLFLSACKEGPTFAEHNNRRKGLHFSGLETFEPCFSNHRQASSKIWTGSIPRLDEVTDDLDRSARPFTPARQ